MRRLRTLALAIAAAACMGVGGLVTLASAGGSQATTGNLTLAGGQTEIIRCVTIGEHWTGANVFPHAVTCPLHGTTTTTAPVTTTVPATTSTTSGTGPSGYFVPPASLMPNSIFNKPVASDMVLPNSPAIVANFVGQYHSAYGQVGINFNRPVYYASASTPDVSMSVSSGCNDFTPSTGTEIPIPANAIKGDSSDNILTVYQPASNKVWEFWEAVNNGNGSWSACWGGEAPLSTTDGVFPANYGETATGISNLATEITEADIDSGSINHAIEFEVLGDQCDSAIPPADREDCGYNNPNYPAEGMYFRFAANTAMPGGLTPFAQMVFKAISTYGMVVSDQGGAVALEADMAGNGPGPWELEGNSQASDPIIDTTGGQQEYQLVAGFPWNDLQAIAPPSYGLYSATLGLPKFFCPAHPSSVVGCG